MPDDTQKLLNMKKEIQKKEKEESELTGRITELESRLKKDFGCYSLKEADRKLDNMTKDETDKQGLLSKGIADLEKQYEWN